MMRSKCGWVLRGFSVSGSWYWVLAEVSYFESNSQRHGCLWGRNSWKSTEDV